MGDAMKTALLMCVAFVFVSSASISATDDGVGYIPSQGFVPDAVTATAVSRAVLIPIYGAKKIKEEEPLVATKQNDVWIVNGTLHCGAAKSSDCVGGTARIKLSAKDGRILFVTHYQ